MAEGKVDSYDKAKLAVRVLKEEDLPEGIGEDEALVAADNCDDVYSATKFLRQECELCASTMNVKQACALNTEKVLATILTTFF